MESNYGSNQEGNYAKLNFGRALNEAGPNGFITSDQCHNYGSVSGCDSDCPVFVRGECEIQEENVEHFNQHK